MVNSGMLPDTTSKLEHLTEKGDLPRTSELALPWRLVLRQIRTQSLRRGSFL